MPISLPDLYDQPSHLLRRAQQISIAVTGEALRPHDVTPAQFEIMLAIRAQPGIDGAGLTNAVAFDRSTMATALERLERKGMIERHSGPHDRRSKQVFLSPAGNQTILEAASAYKAAQKRILQGLARSEQWQLLTLMERLVSLNNDLSRAPLRTARSDQ
ncbi:MarR family winged helix-turn-helix transcriptional regulator [Tepidamorphus sp. 3E244]|uniref:MarR family winged helix-turn-helix transcriptional regulator n=1 Tax=Tepidamorphus sp. 3E244 TaxID=3385498 RepID=UPI0038FC5A0C